MAILFWKLFKAELAEHVLASFVDVKMLTWLKHHNRGIIAEQKQTEKRRGSISKVIIMATCRSTTAICTHFIAFHCSMVLM